MCYVPFYAFIESIQDSFVDAYTPYDYQLPAKIVYYTGR